MNQTRVHHPPSVGDRIRGHSEYQIGRPLGDGYFGRVYECTDEWGNDLVAKVLHPRGSYSDVKGAWSSELDKLLHLRHPTITFVYDAFEYRDTFYLIIERCLADLNALVATIGYSGNLWINSVARDLLQGIHYMHASGYVHKDIHPGNVFVKTVHDKMYPSKEPVVCFKIGDLGISRLEPNIRAFGTVLAQWMLPPEHLDPLTFGQMNRTVDLYHAGLLLLGVHLGHFPSFSEKEILDGEPRKLAEKHGGPYSGALAKALRRHVSDRTQTSAEFWKDMQAAAP